MTEVYLFDKGWTMTMTIDKDCPKIVKDNLYKLGKLAATMLEVKKSNSEQNVQGSVATDDASSNADGTNTQ